MIALLPDNVVIRFLVVAATPFHSNLNLFAFLLSLFSHNAHYDALAQVDVVAFDKTGTLTEDGLDLALVAPVDYDRPQSAENCCVSFSQPVEPEHLPKGVSDDVINCMASCHTLTTINEILSGDPLDLKLFEATGWELVEPSVCSRLRCFLFSAALIFSKIFISLFFLL